MNLECEEVIEVLKKNQYPSTLKIYILHEKFEISELFYS